MDDLTRLRDACTRTIATSHHPNPMATVTLTRRARRGVVVLAEAPGALPLKGTVIDQRVTRGIPATCVMVNAREALDWLATYAV